MFVPVRGHRRFGVLSVSRLTVVYLFGWSPTLATRQSAWHRSLMLKGYKRDAMKQGTIVLANRHKTITFLAHTYIIYSVRPSVL